LYFKRSPIARTFLFLAAVVQTEDGFVHHPGEVEDLFDLFFRGDPAVLVLERNSDLGFEEFLLFSFLCHYPFIVSKAVSKVK
jgi:hypothetical protein